MQSGQGVYAASLKKKRKRKRKSDAGKVLLRFKSPSVFSLGSFHSRRKNYSTGCGLTGLVVAARCGCGQFTNDHAWNIEGQVFDGWISRAKGSDCLWVMNVRACVFRKLRWPVSTLADSVSSGSEPISDCARQRHRLIPNVDTGR